MFDVGRQKSFGLLLFTGLLACLQAGSAGAQSVGTVGASNQQAMTTPPGSTTRVLTLGNSVVNKERIQTSGEGSAQITLLDKSTLNIGRNSTVVIDRFVYNAEAGTGEMVTSMSKGVLRFVGGQVSHTRGASVKTPVATIGVRGGMMIVVFLQGGGIIVIDQYGQIQVRNAAGSQTINRPGYAVRVDGMNQPIGEPFPVPPDLLTQVMAQLTSGKGQSGGAIKLPTDFMAARLGMGQSTLPNNPANTPGPGTISIFNQGDTLSTVRSQQLQTNGSYVPPPEPDPAYSGGGTLTNGAAYR
jgi:hypothetical protein